MTDPSRLLVIHNANIITLDSTIPSATALTVDHGHVIAVGADGDILSAFPRAESFDAQGHTIIPGLTDAHIHLEDYALSLQKVDCETSARQECLGRVADRAGQSKAGNWILGHGWNQNSWSEGYGSAAMLDKITIDHPTYLTHKSLHCGWANTAALRQAGITRDTPDPLGGRIGRLPDGEPDGILFESAMALIDKAVPDPSFDQATEAIQSAIPRLWQLGLTGAHDFDRTRCFTVLQELNQRDLLKFRVLKGIPLEDLQPAVDVGLRSGFGDDILRIGGVKMFSDGALGPQTAAMLQPYENDPDNMGMLMMDVDALVEAGSLAVANGISMAVHAIGDRANRVVLDAYAKLRDFEHLLPSTTKNSLRHRIEHVQVIHPSDLPRFAQLNIIPSMQPIHASSDMLMADRYWGDRSKYAYAWRSLLSQHVPLVFGSDAPVESPNPFWGLHTAVTRQKTDGTPSPAGWYPEQRLNVIEALHAYTTAPAYAAGMEDRLGKLAPSYLADLLVLSEDPSNCEPGELRNIRPLATMLGGEWVYFTL